MNTNTFPTVFFQKQGNGNGFQGIRSVLGDFLNQKASLPISQIANGDVRRSSQSAFWIGVITGYGRCLIAVVEN
ncbi:MAG: hypothetical protein IPI11_17130 [Haliscomenobacter sp.]|nr:hypothetical protein [Haliscomenobacter sp.]